jgi:hypothetical protein
LSSAMLVEVQFRHSGCVLQSAHRQFSRNALHTSLLSQPALQPKSPTQSAQTQSSSLQFPLFMQNSLAPPAPPVPAVPPVPPQNPVDGAIVGVSVLGVKLAYPDASLAVRPARNRQIEPEGAA